MNGLLETKARKEQRNSWGVFIGISLLHFAFVGITTALPILPEAVRNGPLHHFDLRAEMNLAAWWSGMWLLWGGLLALELFSKKTQPRLAWLVLSGLLIGLSLDEMGSLHERAGGIRQSMPFILLLAGLLFLSLWLWIRAGQAKLAGKILFFFALFGVVIGLEKLEHLWTWALWAQGPRAGVEEGLELLGGFGLVWTLLQVRNRIIAGSIFPNFEKTSWIQGGLLAGLVLHIALSLWSNANPAKAQLGDPSVWYPAAASFLFFCLLIGQIGKLRSTEEWMRLGLAILFLLASVASMYLLAPRPSSSLLYRLGMSHGLYLIMGALFGAVILVLVSSRKVPYLFLLGTSLLALLLIVWARLSPLSTETALDLAPGALITLTGWVATALPITRANRPIGETVMGKLGEGNV